MNWNLGVLRLSFSIGFPMGRGAAILQQRSRWSELRTVLPMYRDYPIAAARAFHSIRFGGFRMPSSVWKGTLTFGLLAIPIKLYTAARSQRINLHQLHKVCHTRLKQPLFCPHCNRQVDRDEVVRGYEYEKGQYVIVTDEELKKITPRSSTVMELVAFVKQDQIDPIYFDASYFMLPDKEAEKPYALLLKTLEDRTASESPPSPCTSASTPSSFV